MTPALLFDIANTYVLPFWTVMILFPNWGVTKKVMGSYLIFLPLIGLYIYYLVATVDPESAAALANPQLADIARFFSQEGAAGAGWVHFLVMDLFVGRWIYWQGQEKQIWTIHSLIFCLFFGPVGLLSHIITAAIFNRNNNLAETTTDTAVS
ncbi:ABA4-like family protein [Pleurocapsa sp. PCC 7319]|uniref:ABA4-like family protein n=1 Tax=Pleurocapsa sp. PCC 7319 TaxID=118161 RepID=UPI000346F17A|nr:ABA4-like family protein [Pleurocapsa sp. PCC 7319]